MAPKKSTALSTKKAGALAVNAPAFMTPGTAGKERFRQEDVKIPYLTLAQHLSPIVLAGKAKPGDWFNTVSQKVYGPNPVIVPVNYKLQRAEWIDVNQGGGKACQSADGLRAASANGRDEKGKPTSDCMKCVKRLWTTKGDEQIQPKCTEQGTYLVLVNGESDPCILSLQKTSFKAHKALASMIQISEVPIFGNRYTLGSVERILSGKKKGAYCEATATAAGYVEDEKHYRLAEKTHKNTQSMFLSTITEAPE